MRPEAVEQYSKVLKVGQKYYKTAVARGQYPYLPALDDILNPAAVAGHTELGLCDVPAELIAGTRTAGRVSALAGNFMPLLGPKTEFAAKWTALCEAHLSDEGLRDPVQCFEYMGRFYVQEGNKRVSVLLSYDAPTVPCVVTRVVPRYSDEPEVRVYYEFMEFYALSGLYGVTFRREGGYRRLQAALGFAPDHVWSEEERRSFASGYVRLRAALRRMDTGSAAVTPAEVLLVWLQVYPFADLKALSPAELAPRLSALWPDVLAQAEREPIELSTQPEDRARGVLSRLLTPGREHLNIAFIYAFRPEDSPWTEAHDCGRAYLAEHMGDRVRVKTYIARDRAYLDTLLAAIGDGAELVFATTPSMIAACRKAAALHPEVRILNCGLFQPYTGVRMYYTRIHECKFVTGAIAGAMTRGNTIGYVANYPIFGALASVNAFALGVRMTNPRARVRVVWSCCPGDPVGELLDRGVTVISNRDAVRAGHSFELGTYKYRPDGSVLPLAAPLMYWGELYERVALSVFSGAWETLSGSGAINYWWGMDSGVLDVAMDPALPDGVRSLGQMLKDGITEGFLAPFRTRITDRDGTLRCDGTRDLTPDELLTMDWFCDNVDGSIPAFDELLPISRDTVRLLGLYRDDIPPETEARQL